MTTFDLGTATMHGVYAAMHTQSGKHASGGA